LVLELTGKKTPRDGLEGKFSVYHGCACGLMFGKAGEPEFSDAIVNRPDLVALRARVHAEVDNSIDEAAVNLVATLKDGRKVAVNVEHAIGSLERPMPPAQLEAKFHDLVTPILGKSQSEVLLNACWTVASATNLSALLQLTVPA
jgi:2-methylcitrate dehydratase PrpD